MIHVVYVEYVNACMYSADPTDFFLHMALSRPGPSTAKGETSSQSEECSCLIMLIVELS